MKETIIVRMMVARCTLGDCDVMKMKIGTTLVVPKLTFQLSKLLEEVSKSNPTHLAYTSTNLPTPNRYLNQPNNPPSSYLNQQKNPPSRYLNQHTKGNLPCGSQPGFKCPVLVD